LLRRSRFPTARWAQQVCARNVMPVDLKQN
jgi:hypothetical protein